MRIWSGAAAPWGAGGDVHHRPDSGQVLVGATKFAEVDLSGVDADADADRLVVGAEACDSFSRRSRGRW